jgi:hypothetical protein
LKFPVDACASGCAEVTTWNRTQSQEPAQTKLQNLKRMGQSSQNFWTGASSLLARDGNETGEMTRLRSGNGKWRHIELADTLLEFMLPV